MRIKKRTGDRIFKIVAVLFVTLFALICLYPLMMVVSVSFSNETEVLLNGYSVFPQAPTLDTYRYIFVNSGAKIARSYAVTIFITAVGTIGSLLVTSMCAFALSIKKLRYRNVIAYLCNFTIVFSAGLVPWYFICTNVLHLKNSVWSLIIPSLFSVWNMFLMRTYLSQVPYALYESALIEGAGLKGLRVGGAQVSEKHAGFIVNTGGATAADVLALVETIRARVREKYGVELELEIRVV